MRAVGLDSGWRDEEWECSCGWSGPGSATAYEIHEAYADHACPFCAAPLFRVAFYGDTPDPDRWVGGE